MSRNVAGTSGGDAPSSCRSRGRSRHGERQRRRRPRSTSTAAVAAARTEFSDRSKPWSGGAVPGQPGEEMPDAAGARRIRLHLQRRGDARVLGGRAPRRVPARAYAASWAGNMVLHARSSAVTSGRARTRGRLDRAARRVPRLAPGRPQPRLRRHVARHHRTRRDHGALRPPSHRESGTLRPGSSRRRAPGRRCLAGAEPMRSSRRASS